MKKITTIFSLLLLFAVTAMAQTTTVTLAYTAEPFKKGDSQGTMPSAYGTFSNQTYTTNAASGLAGLTLTASSGLTIGEQHVNVDFYGSSFKFETAQHATDYTVTLSAPEGYVIISYYLSCVANSDSRRHTLTATNGTQVEVTSPPYQNKQPKKFTVFGLNQQSTSFTIRTANAGNPLYVPNFTVTLAREGSVVSSLSDLSNDKKYSIICERGTLGTSNNVIDIDIHSTLTAKDFAIVQHEDNYYLWSVVAQKFIVDDVTIAYYPFPTDAVITPAFPNTSSNTEPLFKFYFGNKRLNASANGVTIDGYDYDDGGNMFLIIENGNFDDMEVVEERFEGLTMYREALLAAIDAANAATANVGEGVNKYSVTGGQDALDAALAAAQAELGKDENEQTKEGLQTALQTLNEAVAGLTKTLNLPAPGFYRIKGHTSEKYLGNSTASGKYNMTTDTDATTIFCYDGTNLVNWQTGKCVHLATWEWKFGNDEDLIPATDVSDQNNGRPVKFYDGQSNGGYAIHNGVDKNKNPIHLFDNGDGQYGGGAICVDRGGFAEGSFSDLNAEHRPRYTNWYLEEVTELPVKMNVVGDKSYATFYSPVAISQVDGAKVYVVEQTKDNSVVIEKAETQAIPAGKGVMLVSDEQNESATLTIGEAGDFETGLNGVTASEQITKNTDPYNSNLFLSKKDGKIGFYKIKTTDNVGVTGGFKAYLENVTVMSGAKDGFEIEFGGVTGIENMENGTLNMDGAVYNLQGQRVNKAQKGVFIQNGKKVVVR